jgi:DNA-binding NtrC family response regulator
MVPHRIMIVDDDKNILNALRRTLAAEGREIECYAEPAEALRRAHVANFDIFLSDFRMPQMDGATLLAEIRRLQPEAARFIVSAYTDFDAVVKALNDAGIERFVAKPWNDAELREMVRAALEKRELQVENRRLAEQLRRTQEALAQQHAELARLERENPGITQVRRAADGSILLDESET